MTLATTATRIAGLVTMAVVLATATITANAAVEPTPPPPAAAEPTPGMTNARLEALIRRIDSNAQGRPGFWTFTVDSRAVAVITDEKAGRMRIISAVAKADDVPADRLHRLMQANFDSTLDARYAIAKGTLWSAFVHPLAALTDAQFLSALGQVVNLTLTYGSTYSSGALVFQGGDSAAEQQRRELIQRLLKKGLEV